MTPGFVKLHRKILDNDLLMADAVLLKVFVWCLLKASWQDTSTVERGQFEMGFATAAEEVHVAKTTLREKLSILQREGCIALDSDHSRTIVTVCNYGAYQDRAEEVRPQSDRDPTAIRQPSLVEEEEKEGKNPRRAQNNHVPSLRLAPTECSPEEPTPEQIADEFGRIYCGPIPLRRIQTRDERVAYFAGLYGSHGALTVLAAVQDSARDPTDTPLNFDRWFKASRSPETQKTKRPSEEESLAEIQKAVEAHRAREKAMEAMRARECS